MVQLRLVQMRALVPKHILVLKLRLLVMKSPAAKSSLRLGTEAEGVPRTFCAIFRWYKRYCCGDLGPNACINVLVSMDALVEYGAPKLRIVYNDAF